MYSLLIEFILFLVTLFLSKIFIIIITILLLTLLFKLFPSFSIDTYQNRQRCSKIININFFVGYIFICISALFFFMNNFNNWEVFFVVFIILKIREFRGAKEVIKKHIS